MFYLDKGEKKSSKAMCVCIVCIRNNPKKNNIGFPFANTRTPLRILQYNPLQFGNFFSKKKIYTVIDLHKDLHVIIDVMGAGYISIAHILLQGEPYTN